VAIPIFGLVKIMEIRLQYSSMFRKNFKIKLKKLGPHPTLNCSTSVTILFHINKFVKMMQRARNSSRERELP
jgi:hypothetical protein